MPKKSELASDHRIERPEFEKILGRSLMNLIAAVARETVMRHKDEFGVAVFDECWWLTKFGRGPGVASRDHARRQQAQAAAYVGSHDPDDIGPADSEKGAIIRGLIPHRLLFRQTTRMLAERSLEFFGVNTTDPELLDLVTAGLSPLDLPEEEKLAPAGECLYRDLASRIGLMKVLIPMDPPIIRVIHTTPSDYRAAAGPRSSPHTRNPP
ncbi:ATP-binding protein [Streptomyces sp. NPDC056661]|uniref:ATP-binding protein n=1 Tax=Streptomyces sp. NPDC056661 TaxID=3345898 RepID=UPI0036C7760E